MLNEKHKVLVLVTCISEIFESIFQLIHRQNETCADLRRIGGIRVDGSKNGARV